VVERKNGNKMSGNNQEDRPGHCMCNGCICCYDAYDFEDFVFCCAGTCDCICIRQAVCCAIGYESLGFGIVTNEDRGECCKIGLLCCECGLIQPSTLCRGASQFLCCQQVASLPFDDDYVKDCVCGCYGIQCAPNCGCCMAPPVAKAFQLLRNTQTLAASNVVAASGTAEPMDRT
jgi:hypothetical protein